MVSLIFSYFGFVSSSDIEVSSEFFDPNIFLYVIWQDIIFSWKQKNSPYLNILFLGKVLLALEVMDGAFTFQPPDDV